MILSNALLICLLPSLLATNLPGLPALFTTLRRISEAFLMKELLFSGRPGELLFTVNAGAYLIFKFAHFWPFFLKLEPAMMITTATSSNPMMGMVISF
jgi:hypothetical protein